MGVDGEQPIADETVVRGFETEVLIRPRRTWEDLIQSYGRAGAHSDAVRRVELGLLMTRSPDPSIRFPGGLVEDVARRLEALEERRPRSPAG